MIDPVLNRNGYTYFWKKRLWCYFWHVEPRHWESDVCEKIKYIISEQFYNRIEQSGWQSTQLKLEVSFIFISKKWTENWYRYVYRGNFRNWDREKHHTPWKAMHTHAMRMTWMKLGWKMWSINGIVIHRLTCSWRFFIFSFSSSTCLSHSRQKSSKNWHTSDVLLSLKYFLARSCKTVNDVSGLLAGCRCGDFNWLIP